MIWYKDALCPKHTLWFEKDCMATLYRDQTYRHFLAIFSINKLVISQWSKCNAYRVYYDSKKEYESLEGQNQEY